MAAPMKAIIFVFSVFLHSDFVSVNSKQLTSRDHNLVFIQENSFLDFSPFIHNHRHIRSIGLNNVHNLSPRHKRDIFTKQQRRLSIAEDKTGLIYQFTDTSRIYVLVSASVPDLLEMNGYSLMLISEKKLDYEDPKQRTITVIVNGTKSINDVQETTLVITVTNINDESPVFKNQPKPFLATVSANTPANVMVYEVYAEDTDPNSNVTYALQSGAEGRFRLETSNIYDKDLRTNIKVGRILTEGQGQFVDGKPYVLLVIAQDVSIRPAQRTLEKVHVLVGVRPPQFYETKYLGSVLENNGIGHTLQNQLKVKAKPFQENTVTYQLYDENNVTSSKFRIDHEGTVRTLQKLDYESVARQLRPPVYKLQIRAIESQTNLVTIASLVVTVLDDNDNRPSFDLSRYTSTVKENLAIGAIVMQVTATDDDSGKNAELEYSVDHDHFEVETKLQRTGESVGIIKVKMALDYDEVAGHLYTFDITARDKGEPVRSGTAKIRVFTTNVNDNPPELQIPTTINLQENTEAGAVVTLLNAVDLDGDIFKYYFSPQLSHYKIFEIVEDSGLIKTTAVIPTSVNHYVLNITMIDDGSCCDGRVQQTSEAYVVIEITDINDHKPDFTNCTGYAKIAKVYENEPIGTSVITVSATDSDRGNNGEVKYSISRSAAQPGLFFEIDEKTGLVTTAQEFDREKNRFYSLTVVGHDGGIPSQEGYCTFRVYIEDKNDNHPKFDQSEYKATIPQSFGFDRSVITIRATDADVRTNAEISYSIVPNGDSSFFKIDPDVGVIKLNKTAMNPSFVLTVMAKDHGTPPLNSTVKVTVSVANLTSIPPSWIRNDYDASPYTVKETAPRGTHIAKFYAQSNVANKIVSFALIDENGYPKDNIDPFTLIKNSAEKSVTLAVQGAMNYRKKKSYQLRLRVTNRGAISLNSEIHPIINLNDTNNEIPVFYGRDKQSGYYPGSVAENQARGQTVIQIRAEDLDAWWPNNKLTYELRDPPNAVNVSHKFYLQVDPLNNNSVVVKSNVQFDREVILNSKLYVDIWVKDGAPSTIKNDGTPNTALTTIEVTITDMNDNFPYFPKAFYNATVKEDATIGSKVIMVRAEDVDSAANLVYSISNGNIRNAFKVQEKSGLIMIARQLDYESTTDPKIYIIEMTVNDGLHTNRTKVFIHIEDVNDNPPMFTQDPYLVNNVVEEDPNISPSNRRYLLTVTATDADLNRPTEIEYTLMGAEAKNFEIDRVTGRLFLLNPLDRDEPNGKALYQFNVRAQDEVGSENFGYTAVEVRPIDINDNNPYNKGDVEGKVLEHSPHGSKVFNVFFGDYDEGRNGTGGLTYSIIAGETDGQNLMFSIDQNGLIRTNTNRDNLDREKIAEYHPTIVVKDDGPGNSRRSQELKITIRLDDINDQKPKFQRKIYQVEMSENQKSGQIARVVATDADIGLNCKLEYSLLSDKEFFRIDTINNEGSIIVVKAVNYEYPNKQQQFFNITVKVQDPNPEHTDIAYVELTVLDFNDNKPVFTNPIQDKQFPEDVPVGTSIAHFSASDKDSGVNRQFTFSIDRATDPKKLFTISQVGNEGNVTIRRKLDRETVELHVLHILAIDKGDPALTGTAILSVTVLDVNDNAPIFAGDYHPVVMENDKNYPKMIIKVNGTDLDGNPYGPPFGFADLCPAHPVCEFFSLKFEPDGDGKKGWALVSTKTEYDREKTKLYYMPIVMWDMRGHKDQTTKSKTGTNTLTIEIGDENDNKHGPGHKEIFVYNYKGMFGDIEIGNVYATDPDDWDSVDKDYIYTGPEYMKKYFVVNQNTGIITMQKGVPAEDSPYTFTVRVVDNHWQGLAADCSVTVTIQDLSEEAVYNSGAVRLTGITAEEFVDRKKTPGSDVQEYEDSKLDVFRKLLADKLQVPTANVDIISIMNNGKFTDVRYTAHGSPYYPSERTNTILALNKKEFENKVGINIAMVPIDECREEVFEGGCYNFLNVTGKPNLINTNGTSLIGVETLVQAKEGCRSAIFPPVQQCFPTYCLNGGQCKLDDWLELSCDCLPGFNGPRCQQTRHSFDGHSYSLFETLEQCEEGQTSIYIITTKENGLIMYNGPAGALGPDDPRDFISLELLDGYPKLRIDHGTGELLLYVDGRDSHQSVKMQKLSDGKWHRIDIIRTGRNVEMIVDHCEASRMTSGVTFDDVMCRKFGETPGENIFLNVDTLLHLGGTFVNPTYPGGLQQAKFDGCVKNLMHNGKMYDLTVKESANYPSGKPGCNREDEICRVNSIEGPICGENGICESTWNPPSFTCICKPKWRGSRCSIETTTKDMKEGSYFEWHLNNNFYNHLLGAGDWKLQLHIMFRTRDEDGVLLTMSSADSSQVITIQIIKKRLTLTYNLDGTNRNLELYYKEVSNGQWHTLEMQRFGLEFILKMDNGEGRNYNSTREGTRKEMKISTTVHAGAILSQSSGVTVVDKDLAMTCVNDIRMNNRYFPMQFSENEAALAAELKKNPNVADGCIRDDCAGVVCPPPEVCYPLWNSHECRCPIHYEEIGGVCVAILYCKDHNCFSGSTCVEDTSEVKGYRCDCPPGWSGDFCNRLSEAFAEAGITTGAIAAIVISVFVLLLLALAVILLVKCGKPKKADDKYILEVDSYDDIRENVINYDEEGAGEEDQEGYDMSRLRKPEDAHSLYKPPLDPMMRRDMPLSNAPGESPDVGNFINDRLGDADDDGGAPPYDSVREFAYEGVDSDAGSLSSLNTSSSTRSQDYDYLNDWGPKFAKLADMYGAGQEPEED